MKRKPAKRRSKKPTPPKKPQPKRGIHARTRPPAKRKRAPAKKKRSVPAKRKRAPAKKKRSSSKKRSAAAKKGWAKRRKKQKLLKAMADLREQHSDQPIGWLQRRAEQREINGEIWREISVEFSETAYQAERLANLAELEIDFATRDELREYLEWLADELDVDISVMYRMYLGYSPNGQEI